MYVAVTRKLQTAGHLQDVGSSDKATAGQLQDVCSNDTATAGQLQDVRSSDTATADCRTATGCT
jgi:hypothetical protein